MERARGLSFVRGTLAEEPLSETNWVKMLGATGSMGYAMGSLWGFIVVIWACDG